VPLKTFISIQTPWLELMEANCNLSESSLYHRWKYRLRDKGHD